MCLHGRRQAFPSLAEGCPRSNPLMFKTRPIPPLFIFSLLPSPNRQHLISAIHPPHHAIPPKVSDSWAPFCMNPASAKISRFFAHSSDHFGAPLLDIISPSSTQCYHLPFQPFIDSHNCATVVDVSIFPVRNQLVIMLSLATTDNKQLPVRKSERALTPLPVHRRPKMASPPPSPISASTWISGPS